MKSDNRCPVHVAVSMKEESGEFIRNNKHGKRKIRRTFFRCPVPGCGRVQASDVEGGASPAVFSMFGADCLT